MSVATGEIHWDTMDRNPSLVHGRMFGKSCYLGGKLVAVRVGDLISPPDDTTIAEARKRLADARQALEAAEQARVAAIAAANQAVAMAQRAERAAAYVYGDIADVRSVVARFGPLITGNPPGMRP